MDYKNMTMGQLNDARRAHVIELENIEREINDRMDAARNWRQDALRGDKISAIKKVRTLLGFGLYESKQMVEEFLSFQNTTVVGPWSVPAYGDTTLGDVLRDAGYTPATEHDRGIKGSDY